MFTTHYNGNTASSVMVNESDAQTVADKQNAKAVSLGLAAVYAVRAVDKLPEGQKTSLMGLPSIWS